MQVSSGVTFDKLDVQIITDMAEYGFVRYSEEPFKLKSGILSHVYVFGREDLTDHPELEWSLGKKIAQAVVQHHQPDDRLPCLIGIPTAGTALAQAAAMVSWKERILTPDGHWLCHRIMREALKEHGAHRKWVNGDPSDLYTFWTVDNVVTDGASKFEAAEKLLESGYPVTEMPSFILVDRQQGGVKRMVERGFPRIVVVYRLLDITFALGELGFWPKDLVGKVEEEIRAHQFAA